MCVRNLGIFLGGCLCSSEDSAQCRPLDHLGPLFVGMSVFFSLLPSPWEGGGIVATTCYDDLDLTQESRAHTKGVMQPHAREGSLTASVS